MSSGALCILPMSGEVPGVVSSISSMASSSASLSLQPSEPRNFMPLYSAGLWDALITAPPSAFRDFTA